MTVAAGVLELKGLGKRKMNELVEQARRAGMTPELLFEAIGGRKRNWRLNRMREPDLRRIKRAQGGG